MTGQTGVTGEAIRHFATDLAVVGSGIAGFAAAIFAANRSIATAQIGNTGAVAYTTGYLDLLGQQDDSPAAVNDPWQALAVLRQSQPDHPLSSMPAADIRRSFTEFTAFLGDSGLAYSPVDDCNITALTPVGTVKQTLCVPATMAAGPRALADKSPCVIVDFKGLKGFSGRQVVANLRERWPELRTERLVFPEMARGEVYPEAMARALEVPAIRQQLAKILTAAARDTKILGLPAILGMHRPDLVRAELERLTGLTIFEIPTMPPSVPGIRLREMFEQALPKHGVTLIPQQKITGLDLGAGGATLTLRDNYGPISISARAVILATGRFLSGGLEAHPHGIKEHLLDLPVVQPGDRSLWYRERYTDRRGHAIHRAGIKVDGDCRPLQSDGRPRSDRLFAAGIILAHQDWIRSRSGAGIAIATAYRAVQAVERFLLSQR
jgi:glycerol-3-phosphate dehydrogenase subunit B